MKVLSKSSFQEGVKAFRKDIVWNTTAVVFWALLPILQLQRAQITLFDLFVLLMLGVLVLQRVNRTFLSSRLTPRQEVTTPISRSSLLFYGLCLLLIFAGLMSGLNTNNIKLWFLENMTFVYLLVMALTIDMFAREKVESFIYIGSYVLTVIFILTGLGAVLDALGIYKVMMFYPPINEFQANDKFRGFAMAPNQWGAIVTGFLPIVLAAVLKHRSYLLLSIIVTALFLGALSAPMTGSRFSIIMLTAELAMFISLFVLMNRSVNTGKRVLLFFASLVIAFAVYLTVQQFMMDSWVVQRSLKGIDLVANQTPLDDWRTLNFSWAIMEYKTKPFLGIGFGTFELYHDFHEVHSSYLSLLVEAGPLAVLAYIGLLVLSMTRMLHVSLLNAATRTSNVLPFVLFVSVFGQAIGGIFHNLTRNRHIFVLGIVCILYSEWRLEQHRRNKAARSIQANMLKQHHKQRQRSGRPIRRPGRRLSTGG